MHYGQTKTLKENHSFKIAFQLAKISGLINLKSKKQEEPFHPKRIYTTLWSGVSLMRLLAVILNYGQD